MNYTRLDEHILTDGSKVYDIRVTTGNTILTLDCVSLEHAIELQKQLEECTCIDDGC